MRGPKIETIAIFTRQGYGSVGSLFSSVVNMSDHKTDTIAIL